MKIFFFLIFVSAAYAQNIVTTSDYALVNGDGTIIEIFVATPEIAQKYPDAAKQAFPDAVKCVPAMGAGIGWSYDTTNNNFIPPPAETVVNVTSKSAVLPSESIPASPIVAPVVAVNSTIPVTTNNNVGTTTINAAVLTANTTNNAN